MTIRWDWRKCCVWQTVVNSKKYRSNDRTVQLLYITYLYCVYIHHSITVQTWTCTWTHTLVYCSNDECRMCHAYLLAYLHDDVGVDDDDDRYWSHGSRVYTHTHIYIYIYIYISLSLSYSCIYQIVRPNFHTLHTIVL